ncbi:MAG TPA: radical SAM family heme chaperone HemW [Candidatus Limnocylindria bacterium]|nr:radical SAM family heme chaperone HemW [Candidatus Limnocylindria bacterium]
MTAAATAANDSHHLYVHVPFCRLVCAYCDFVTVGGRASDIPLYVDALLAELEARPAPGRLETIYLGGGTPSLLPAAEVGRIIEAATRRWAAAPIEVTLEANPSGREAPDWQALRRAGTNRISLGVQSLRDADLQALARGHSADEARAAYAATRDAGFDNVSVDLIYGIPGQSLDDWDANLRAAVDLQPDHLSLYALQLALDPDEWAAPPRPGALRWRRRMAQRQDDDLAARQYVMAETVLRAAGYHHYELSSWARPGRESRHNSAYWSRRAYTGIGAGAHSYDGAAQRAWNERDLDAYLSAVETRGWPRAGGEELDEPTRAFEAVALGLRRVDGLSRGAFAAEFGADPTERYAAAVGDAAERGLLKVDLDSLRLTPAGRLMANDALIGFAPDPVATG